jgi:hypothetical protein
MDAPKEGIILPFPGKKNESTFMSDTERREENHLMTLLFAQSGKNMAVEDVRA